MHLENFLVPEFFGIEEEALWAPIAAELAQEIAMQAAITTSTEEFIDNSIAEGKNILDRILGHEDQAITTIFNLFMRDPLTENGVETLDGLHEFFEEFDRLLGQNKGFEATGLVNLVILPTIENLPQGDAEYMRDAFTHQPALQRILDEKSGRLRIGEQIRQCIQQRLTPAQIGMVR